MGYRLAFTDTIGAMLEYGPDLRIKAHCGSCDTWPAVDLIAWAQDYGADFTFWDWIEPCTTCGRALTFLCSPGPTTPMLPMWTDAGRTEAFKLNDAIWKAEHAAKSGVGVHKNPDEHIGGGAK